MFYIAAGIFFLTESRLFATAIAWVEQDKGEIQ